MSTNLTNISEETRDELAQMMLTLSNKKETRGDLLKLLKKDNPERVIPEIDAAAAVESKITDLDKKFAEFLAAQQAKEQSNDLNQQKEQARGQFNLTDDDMKKVEELMVNRKVLNYQDAAKLYSIEKTPEEVNDYGHTGYGPAELPNDAELLANPDKFALSTAHRLIDEANRARNIRKF